MGNWLKAERDTALATVLALIGALLLFSFRTIPIITADEIGYLGIARELVWGTGPSMVRTDIYSAGYALLLTPFEWLFRDPRAVYHGAMALNAAALAATVPVLVALARAFRFDAAPRITPWFALIVAFWPSQLFQAYLALPEVGLRLLTMSALLVGFRVTRGGGWAAALSLAVLSAVAFAFHARMIPLVGLSGMLIVLATVRRRLAWYWAGLALVVMVAGCIAIESLNGLMQAELWENRRPVGGNIAQLLEAALQQPVDFLLRLLGHVWYQAASTALVGMVGALLLVYWVVRDRSDIDRAIMSGVILCLLAAIAGAGASKLIVPQSFDWLIYGRFLDVVTPAPLLLGALAFIHAEWRRRLAPWMIPLGLAVCLGGAAIYYIYAGRDLGGPNLIEVGGLTPFVMVLSSFSQEASLTLLAPALTAIVGLLAFLAGGKRSAMLALAFVFVGCTTFAVFRSYVELNRKAESRMAEIAQQYAQRGDEPVWIDRSAGGGQLYIHQYMLQLHFQSADLATATLPGGAIVLVGAQSPRNLVGRCLAKLPEGNSLVRVGGTDYQACPG